MPQRISFDVADVVDMADCLNRHYYHTIMLNKNASDIAKAAANDELARLYELCKMLYKRLAPYLNYEFNEKLFDETHKN